MADLNLPANAANKKLPGRRTKKLSTRIDLTPMVDLGFLLITFFLFTTTLAQPKVMSVMMPVKTDDPTIETPWREGRAMTILLSANHRLYYYDGLINSGEAGVTTFQPKGGIRDVIIDKIKRVNELRRKGIIRPSDDAAFLIKPDVTSTYDDFVKIMDEMNINDIKMKAVVDITPEDKALIAQKEHHP